MWGEKEERENRSNGSDTVKFPLKGTRVASSSSSSSSSKKIKKKWQSREERKIANREHDPADGVCLSGSESEDSDWSIGWLEPHGPDFLCDDETDDSFAVLVPCYSNDRWGPVQGPNTQLQSAIKNLTNEHFKFNEGKNLTEQWLSSLPNF